MEIRTQFDDFRSSMKAEIRSMKEIVAEILLSLNRLEQQRHLPPTVNPLLQPLLPSPDPSPVENQYDNPQLLLSPPPLPTTPPPISHTVQLLPTVTSPLPGSLFNSASTGTGGAPPTRLPISAVLTLPSSSPVSPPLLPPFPGLPNEIRKELICADFQSDLMGLCLGDEIPAEPPPIASPTAAPPPGPSAAIEGASYVVEDVIESAQNGCPGLSILQSGPCLHRFMLELPESLFVLGTCKKKKDAEHDAALKALDQLSIHPSKDNPTSEEGGEGLVSRITYLFSDKFLAFQLPMSGHFRATLRRERDPRMVKKINNSIGQDPHSTYLIGVMDIYGFENFKMNMCLTGLLLLVCGLFPNPILAAGDGKVSNLCISINPTVELNPCLGISSIKSAASSLSGLLASYDGKLWITRLNLYPGDLVDTSMMHEAWSVQYTRLYAYPKDVGSLLMQEYCRAVYISGSLEDILESTDEFEFEIGVGVVISHLKVAVTQMSIGQSTIFSVCGPDHKLILADADDSSRSFKGSFRWVPLPSSIGYGPPRFSLPMATPIATSPSNQSFLFPARSLKLEVLRRENDDDDWPPDDAATIRFNGTVSGLTILKQVDGAMMAAEALLRLLEGSRHLLQAVSYSILGPLAGLFDFYQPHGQFSQLRAEVAASPWDQPLYGARPCLLFDKGLAQPQLLILWQLHKHEGATGEAVEDCQKVFPSFDLEDKVNVEGEGNDACFTSP